MGSGEEEEYDPNTEKSLLAEYDQTWRDFRHRTTIEVTILSVYFAAVAGLVYTFAQHGTGAQTDWIGLVIGTIGILLSIGVLSLLLGERRAWSADVTRLEELESLLSHEEKHPARLERIRNYDRLWTMKGYSVSLAGSFAWYLLVVGFTGGLFGWILGIGLAETFGPSTVIVTILSSTVVALLLVAIVCTIVLQTRRDSLKRMRDQEGKA